MKFRPCIDIHNGEVKQIVGSSIMDSSNYAKENFVSKNNAAFYSHLYREKGLSGGHIILLNPIDSPFYKKTKEQAISALEAFPMGLQVGGGITPDNSKEFLDKGASHVIVTSYVFHNGEIEYHNLKKMRQTVGKDKLVLDLSCKRKDDSYYIMTDRWQKYTSVILSKKVIEELSAYCDEFLIHAVDVEGKSNGIEEPIISILAEAADIPITYAGGVHTFSDLERLSSLGKGNIDVTIGSSLDLFGGTLKFNEVLSYIEKNHIHKNN